MISMVAACDTCLLSFFQPRINANERESSAIFNSLEVSVAQNNSSLKLRALEIENHAHFQPGDPQVIQHLPAFMVGNRVNYFRVQHNGTEGNLTQYLRSLASISG